MYRVLASEAHHWPGIRSVMARTPMGSAMPLIVTRSEDRAIAYPNLGGESVSFIACHGSDVVGYAHARIELRRMWNAEAARLEPMRVMYGGDFRLLKEHRGSGLAMEILDSVRREVTARGVRIGYGLINEGNDKMLGIMHGGKVGARTKVQRTFVTASRLLVTRPSPVRRPVVTAFTPSEEDLRGIESQLASRVLSPVDMGGALVELVRRHPEIRFFRRVDNGRFVFALWDQYRARQLTMAKLSPSLALIAGTWNALRVATGAHTFPKTGTPWRSADVFLAARDELPDRFDDVLAREAWELGCHMVLHVESGLEPAFVPKLRGPSVRMRTHLLTWGIDGEAPPPIPESANVHLDLTFI